MPTVDDSFVQRLERELGKKAVVTDPDVCEPYGLDESGEGPYPPSVVVRPQKPDQVRVVLELAEEASVCVTARGAGTGKSGGALPICGGLVLSMEKMNRILDVDDSDLVAVVEPGVILEKLQQTVEAQSLFYPPDPASLDSCTIAGNVAENAGGPRAVRYGTTGRYVLGAEVGLMGGGKLELGGRTVKNVSGYDLTSLMVGSEGTLGVLTRIQLRLVSLPREVAALWAVFDDLGHASTAISSLLRSGYDPRCLELIDAVALAHGAAEISGLTGGPPRTAATGKAGGGETRGGETGGGKTGGGKIDRPGAGAALLVELDGHGSSIEPRLLGCGEICEQSGATDVRVATDESSRRRLWAARRQISTSLKEAHPHKVSEDIGVPLGCIGEMIEEIARIGRKHSVETAVYGHAGDGNLHVNFLADTPEAKKRLIETAATELMVATLAHGGTLSAEHGIGSAKKRWMAAQFPPQELDMMRSMKKLWDPKNLLNPKKLFP
jgi:glycolate oxidase